MDREVIEESLLQTEKALANLKDAVETVPPVSDLLRDGTIQWFEVAYERLWKTFRKLHILRGIKPEKVRRSYEAFAEAGAAGWLKNRLLWEQMIQDRNFTSHEYNEPNVVEIHRRIVQEYYPEMQRAFDFVKTHYYHQTPFDQWKDRAP